jgi:hypothetical protein
MNFTIKDAIILLLITIVGVTIANLIALKVAATQVQSSLQGTSMLGMLTSAFSSTPGTPAATS